MLTWALIFAVIALVAGVFGFGGVASAAAGIARILFFIFIVIFLITLIAALLSLFLFSGSGKERALRSGGKRGCLWGLKRNARNRGRRLRALVRSPRGGVGLGSARTSNPTLSRPKSS
jgi:uncharacterized membrane protein YtjA (UPF0391 family)